MKLLELVEQEQSIRFTFGRFNPPHIGHKKLLDAVGDGLVFISHTYDKNKNPLMPKEKVGFMRSMFPQHAKKIIYNESAKTIIDIMKLLQKEGHKNVTMIVGDDRVQAFQNLLRPTLENLVGQSCLQTIQTLQFQFQRCNIFQLLLN